MKNYKKNKKILEKSFNYTPEMEHDACVGLIASTNGKKSRKIVEYGIEALKLFGTEELWMQTGNLEMVPVFKLR